jgi:pimeloyl-ACP methyl ester carboxylesterase
MTGIPLGNPTIALNALGMALAAFRPFAESPLYPIPWRGWHKGSLESHVLEEHLNLAFDRAGLGELANLFEWATEDRLGGVEENLVERFESLDLPLLVVAGRHDDLAPPASVRPCYDRSRSSDRTYKELPFGHIDMLVGKHAPSQTWPLVSQWLAHRCGQGSHGALDHAAE